MRSILILLAIALLPLTGCSDAPGGGSAEPWLAPGPGGSVLMSWLEPDGDDTVLQFSVLDGDTWSAPRTIARGNNWFVNWADFPSVVAIDDSLWAAHWLVKAADGTYEYDVAVSLSTDGGETWQDPVKPHTDGTLSEHGFVSLYPERGGVGALWLDGRSMEQGMTLRSAVISPDGTLGDEALADNLVCDCCQTDVAIGSNGPIAVYRNRTEDEIRDIYVMRMVDGAWEAGRPVNEDGWEIAGCPVNGPAIAASENQVAVAWFTAAGGKPRVKFSRSTDGAETFGKPIEIAADRPLGRVGIELLDDGNALVSWLEQGDGGKGEVRVRAVSPDGLVGDATTIATTDAGRLSGFPQMLARAADVVFAWTSIADGGTTVKTAIVTAASLVKLPEDAPQSCPAESGITLQVLGSGGPIADDGRASTSYLVWVDGKSRIMIDTGGGSFLRFGEAGASWNDLDFIGLSHFHTDHSADFPALLKSGFFADRERELAIAGPGAGGPFPALTTYLDSMLNKQDGAYGYLAGYLDGSGNLPKLAAVEVSKDEAGTTTVYDDEDSGIRVDAMHVPHAIVPALAYRVTIGDAVIVFSSDQNLGKPEYADFARGASLLVAHMPLPESATSGTQLHALPSRIGEFAADVEPDTLLLSHFMARSLANLDENVATVRAAFDGEIVLANDLSCVDYSR